MRNLKQRVINRKNDNHINKHTRNGKPLPTSNEYTSTFGAPTGYETTTTSIYATYTPTTTTPTPTPTPTTTQLRILSEIQQSEH